MHLRPLLLAAVAVGYSRATDLLLPLYSHPGVNGAAWSSVQQALGSNSGLDATVVINVDHGPGAPFSTADRDHWIAGGRGLGDLPNVSLIGYVYISRCRRPLDQAKADVTSWASWKRNQRINIDGIFIDEAPNDGSCLDYLTQLTSHIRRTTGLPVVVLNPGFPATPRALDTYYDNIRPTFISALETCFSTTSNGQDLCTGAYTVYDQQGYGTTIDTTLQAWVGRKHYASTAILVHGFHGSNGRYQANRQTLVGAMEAIADRDIGAAVFSTNHWITPDVTPGDIGTVASVMANV
jgi:hypothetical protein